MGIETLKEGKESVTLPLYPEISSPKHNGYSVGDEYDIRLAGKAELGYAHKAKLVSKDVKPLNEVDPYVIALSECTPSRSEALSDMPFDTDQEVVVLYFLRMDKVEEFVKGVSFDPEDIDYKDITSKSREDL